jgi:hypothetical protein
VHPRAERTLPRSPTDVTVHGVQSGPPAVRAGRALDRGGCDPGRDDISLFVTQPASQRAKTLSHAHLSRQRSR